MKEDRKTKEKKIMQMMLFPIAILLGIVPIIVRVSKINSTDIEQNQVFKQNNFYDYFSQSKAHCIMAIIIAMIFLWFLCYDKDYIKKRRGTLIGLIGTGIFILGTIISTIFSEHHEIALWGVYNRAEGLVVILCYTIMFTYVIYAFNTYEDIRFIVTPLIFLVLVNVGIGLTQYYGKDVFKNPGKILNLVVPDTIEYYNELKMGLCNLQSDQRVYGTMNHYNYMGSFGAMMVPFFMTLILFTKGIKKKVAIGIGLVGSIFLLLTSTSRAGLVGSCVAIVILGIVLVKVLIKYWKYSLGGILGLMILLIAFNTISDGNIFSRIPSLMHDVLTIISGESGKEVDYRDSLPIRAFKSINGEILVELQDNELHFKLVKGEVEVTDQEGEKVAYSHFTTEGFEAYEGDYVTDNPDFEVIQYSIWNTNLTNYGITPILKIETYDKSLQFNCKLGIEDSKIDQIDLISGKIIEQEEAPYIGFEGKERLGSARGYIWSRTLPILKDTYLVGKGPDNFIFYFPRYDRLAKMWAYDGLSNMIVDKPHSLYLQIAINEGGIALVGFLIMIGTYLINALRLYALKRDYCKEQVAGLAVMVAVVGYVVAGIFNDSIVSVAPIFWILLGTGMALNELNVKNKKELEDE